MLCDQAEVLDQRTGFTTEQTQTNVIVFVSPFPQDKNQARRKNEFSADLGSADSPARTGAYPKFNLPVHKASDPAKISFGV